MIIAIDGYEANTPNPVGIGRYAFEIIRNLLKMSEDGTKTDLNFRVYLPESGRTDLPSENEHLRYRVQSVKRLWTFIGLPLGLSADFPKADVCFSPTHYVPRFVRVPRVMSIMDISYLTHPDLFRPQDLYKLRTWTAYSVSVSRRILTISEHSRRAIIEAYGIPPESVIVTYPGIPDRTCMRKIVISDLCKKYGISKNYILSVGTIQPRKNYERLIEAFSLFLAKNKQKFSTPQLVIVGKKGWLYESILESPKKYGIGDQVKFLDFVPDDDLSGLYRSALCFALPSLYEGFGFPVAEAMKEGCPVVVSNTSSLPEVAGQAGVYVNPESVKSISEGLLKAVRERNLMQGKARIHKGLKHIEQFSWEKAARQTLEVLEEAAGGKISEPRRRAFGLTNKE